MSAHDEWPIIPAAPGWSVCTLGDPETDPRFTYDPVIAWEVIRSSGGGCFAIEANPVSVGSGNHSGCVTRARRRVVLVRDPAGRFHSFRPYYELTEPFEDEASALAWAVKRHNQQKLRKELGFRVEEKASAR
jgi:hypothetical protein